MISKSLNDTKKIAQYFVENLVPLPDQATVVELIGDLGAGKTTFTQALAQYLNVSETVVSPTFVIQKRYKIFNHPHFETIIHIDAYRLENPDEILGLKWKKDIENPQNLILIEWPSKIKTHIPNSHQIYFTFVDENTREIII